MGEYEPHDSRKAAKQQPGEDEGKRTGWRQQEAADAALGETELEGDERGDEVEQVPDPQAEQALRDAAMEQDAEELDDEAPGDRND